MLAATTGSLQDELSKEFAPPRPKILLVALEPFWTAIPRLPKALQEAGFEAGAACFKESYLAATRFCDRRFFWPATRRGHILERRLAAVVREWHPDLLIAGDELTAVFLSRVFERADPRGELAGLLKFSLGRPESLLEATSKRCTVETARRLGLRVPDSEWIRDEDDIARFARRAGYPIVLKQSFGWAGAHVAVCQDEREARAVFGKWLNPAWKRRFYHWRNVIRGRVLGPRWLPVDRTITANQFIAGRPAMLLAAAFAGETLAAVTARKEQTFPHELGPSSVVRFIRNLEMRRTAERLNDAWGLTGLIGYDFIIDSAGAAWLIECNPRPTPISHLGAQVGEDICRALYCRVAGQPLPPMSQKDGLVVAHFPFEQLRDPNSPHLATAFHDVPWDDPGLLEMLSEIRG
jgi:hypothetical protein